MEQQVVRGRYRLDERLGVGGMSEVWAAEDLELGRLVALKLLAADADAARFEREAQAVAALNHPNICQVFDYGSADGRPFMVLEYLGGGSLEERLVPGEPYADDETRRIASEVAAGLSHAHARGLVHRDLKPANVLFDDEGRAKIADFGIARMGDTITEAGTVLGTAAYISPEQAQGLPATAASDVYSFGVILYRMLTGRLPFEAEQPLELAAMHINEAPPPLTALRPDAPPELALVAEDALAKDPAARPPDGAALLEALGGVGETLSGAPTAILATAPTRVVRPAPARRSVWRSNALPLALAAVILLAGGGAALAYLATRDSGSSNAPSPPPPPVKTTHPRSTATTTQAESSSTTAPTTTRSTSTRPQTTAPPPPPPPPPPPATTTTPPPPPPPPPATTTVPVTTAPGTTTAPPPPPSPPSP